MTKKEFLNFISNGKEDILQQLLDLLVAAGSGLYYCILEMKLRD